MEGWSPGPQNAPDIQVTFKVANWVESCWNHRRALAVVSVDDMVGLGLHRPQLRPEVDAPVQLLAYGFRCFRRDPALQYFFWGSKSCRYFCIFLSLPTRDVFPILSHARKWYCLSPPEMINLYQSHIDPSDVNLFGAPGCVCISKDTLELASVTGRGWSNSCKTLGNRMPSFVPWNESGAHTTVNWTRS